MNRPYQEAAVMPKEPEMPKPKAPPFYFKANKRGIAVIVVTASASIVVAFMADLVPEVFFKTFPAFSVVDNDRYRRRVAAMSYRSHCQGRRNEQARKRDRNWRKFFDITSASLTRQPEPQYLYAVMMFRMRTARKRPPMEGFMTKRRRRAAQELST